MKLITKILGGSALIAIGFFNVSLLATSEKDVNLESLLKTSSANPEDPTFYVYKNNSMFRVTTVDYYYDPLEDCTKKQTTVSWESNCIGTGSTYCDGSESILISQSSVCVN